MSNPSVFDTQYVLVVQATDGDGQPVLLAEGSKYGGTIWTGKRGQGGATAVARRAAEDIEEDLLAGGWTDVAVHVLPVNANDEIDAGFPRPESKEERDRRLRASPWEEAKRQRLAAWQRHVRVSAGPSISHTARVDL